MPLPCAFTIVIIRRAIRFDGDRRFDPVQVRAGASMKGAAGVKSFFLLVVLCGGSSSPAGSKVGDASEARRFLSGDTRPPTRTETLWTASLATGYAPLD